MQKTNDGATLDGLGDTTGAGGFTSVTFFIIRTTNPPECIGGGGRRDGRDKNADPRNHHQGLQAK